MFRAAWRILNTNLILLGDEAEVQGLYLPVPERQIQSQQLYEL